MILIRYIFWEVELLSKCIRYFICIYQLCMYFAWLFSSQPCPSLCDRHFLNTMPCCLVSSSPVFVSILCVVVSSTCSIGVENTSRKEIGGHFFPFHAVLEDIIADTIVTKCSPTHNTSASRSPGPIPY